MAVKTIVADKTDSKKTLNRVYTLCLNAVFGFFYREFD